MRDYLNVLTKIRETPWLITDHGLDVIMGVVNEHRQGKVDQAVLAARLEQAGTHGSASQSRTVLGNAVGVLPVYGPIFGKANLMTELSGATSLEAFRKDLASMLADDSIGSIIMDIDSPGGTSEMVAEAGEEIFAGRDIKPIYAISNNMMGSAAYWLGTQANALYTTPSGSVGSVGAYTVHTDQSGADAQEGINYSIISAGPYKTEGNPHEPLSAEGAAYKQELINEVYDEFVNAVANGRGTDSETVKANFGGGRMVPAKRALTAGMVDGIMEFDALVATASAGNTRIPAKVPVVSGGNKATAFFDKSLGAYVVETGLSSDYNAGQHLEVAEKEHSEPGTGNPPEPRTDGDPNKAAEQGWRRNTTEVERGAETAPKANGGNMDEAQLNQLYELFGVDSEDALVSAITDLHTQQASLASAVSERSETQRFREQFPKLYEQHMENHEKSLKADAKEFLASVSTFKTPNGDGLVDSNVGLSALAADTITESYIAFAKGEGSLETFMSAITAITNGGTLEYGEKGSAKTDSTTTTVDLTTRDGIQAGKNLFADKVAEIQAADKLEYQVAVMQAAERYPDLAQAWRQALPA